MVMIWASCATLVPSDRVSLPQAELDALYEQGFLAYQAKDWAECAKKYELRSEADPTGVHRRASYNAATCRALTGESDAAFIALDRAVKAGWRNVQHLEADPDLASLHADSRWAKVVAFVRAADAAYKKTVHSELYDLYRADQADRAGGHGHIDWDVVSVRDEKRRTRVAEIMDANEAKVADDYVHAAMVFQHGTEPVHYQRAFTWAKAAVKLDPENRHGRWLAAAAEDRYLMSVDEPQKYGTQYRKENGVWVLYEVDPHITDEERARWNVPPIAVSRARAEKMNAP